MKKQINMQLEEGLTVIVKADCPTCQLVAPVLAQLVESGLPLTIYSQDETAFLTAVFPTSIYLDETLERSYWLNIETVPTLIRVENGQETNRLVGWQREEWEAFTGIKGLGPNFCPMDFISSALAVMLASILLSLAVGRQVAKMERRLLRERLPLGYRYFPRSFLGIWQKIMLELLDPTHERQPTERPRTPRPANLEAVTVGLLDIAKMRGDLFLDEISRQLTERGLTIKRYQKPTYAHPAPVALQQQIAAECDVVLEGVSEQMGYTGGTGGRSRFAALNHQDVD